MHSLHGNLGGPLIGKMEHAGGDTTERNAFYAILLGKFQLERMWGDGCMPSAHSATVCAMAIVTGRSAGVSSPIFAVACVVAIITMHDAMGVRHETGEQAKVLNQMIAQWIDVSEKNAPFLQNMHLKEMVGHTPLQVVAGVLLGSLVGFLFPVV